MNFSYFLVLVIIANTSLFGQTPCVNGMAGIYPCNDYDLMSHIDLGAMNASAGNDSWGWTDATTGNEYAIIGLNNGTAFIDVTDPVSPVYLGKLPTATSNSSWRDVKVYSDHAFIVSEASGHGMQVFDLTKLRNVASPPQTFSADANYTGFGNAHNIVINEDTGFAYAVGTSTFNGGPHFVNIQNPTSPTAAGGYSMDGYSHDAQVITYNGPDATYTGSEILIGSNENEVVIVDITNKAAPVQLSTINYSNVGYTHQGWFTEDQRYFLLGDELDEQQVGFDTRTIVFDFQDLNNPTQHMIYTGPHPAIDHNGYVKGNDFYLANYRAGIRVIDVGSIGSQTMTEIGFFDTYPSSDSASFNGVWNVYPYFESGNIVISDIEGGFFLVRKSGTTGPCVAEVPTGVTFPTIGSSTVTVDWNTVANATYEVRHREAGTSSWTTTPATASTLNISGLTPLTQYQVRVRSICSSGIASSYSSSEYVTTTEFMVSYCSSASTDTSDEYISRVQLNTIDNISGAQFYSDFTAISTDLKEGQTYTLTVTPTWTGTVFSEGYAAWIDYNGNGDFDDVGEQIFSLAATQVTPVTVDFTVPAGTILDDTRMRVSMKYNAIPTSCETFQYGEVEDYTVNLGIQGGDPVILSEAYFEAGIWDGWIDGGGDAKRYTGNRSFEGMHAIRLRDDSATANMTLGTFDVSSYANLEVDLYFYGKGMDVGEGFFIQFWDGTIWNNVASYARPTEFSNNIFYNANVVFSSSEYTFTNAAQFRVQSNASENLDRVYIDQVIITADSASALLGQTVTIMGTPQGFSDDDESSLESEFVLYPNPTESILTIQMLEPSEATTYQVVNLLGQVVLKGNLDTGRINVSNLQTGLYLIEIHDGEEVMIGKFVKK